MPMLIIANNRQSITIYSSIAAGRGQLTDDVTTNLVLLVPPTPKTTESWGYSFSQCQTQEQQANTNYSTALIWVGGAGRKMDHHLSKKKTVELEILPTYTQAMARERNPMSNYWRDSLA